MPVCMTPADFQIDPFMYAGSTLANAFHSGLDLGSVVDCVILADSFEAFDAAVSAAIRIKEIGMSIEPECDFCGVSVRPRCSEAESKTCYLNRERHMEDSRPVATRRLQLDAAGFLGKNHPRARPRPSSRDVKITLTVAAAEGEYSEIEIGSHFEGDVETLSLRQGEDVILIAVEDIDVIIDNLNRIAEHLQ